MREEVRVFAEAMERKIKKRELDYPNGWKEYSIQGLFEHLVSELFELQEAINKNEDLVLNECTDVANLAMMIADRAGKLKDESTD